MKRMSIILFMVLGSLNAGRVGVSVNKKQLDPERFNTSRLVRKITSGELNSNYHGRHMAYTFIKKNELTANDIQSLQVYRKEVDEGYRSVVDRNVLSPSALFKFFCCFRMSGIDDERREKRRHEKRYIQEISFLRQLLPNEKK